MEYCTATSRDNTIDIDLDENKMQMSNVSHVERGKIKSNLQQLCTEDSAKSVRLSIVTINNAESEYRRQFQAMSPMSYMVTWEEVAGCDTPRQSIDELVKSLENLDFSTMFECAEPMSTTIKRIETKDHDLIESSITDAFTANDIQGVVLKIPKRMNDLPGSMLTDILIQLLPDISEVKAVSSLWKMTKIAYTVASSPMLYIFTSGTSRKANWA